MRHLAGVFAVVVGLSLTAIPAAADQQLAVRVIKTAVTANYELFEVDGVSECISESFGLTNKLPDPIKMCNLEGWDVDGELIAAIAAIRPETFRDHFLGVAVAVQTDLGRIFVLNLRNGGIGGVGVGCVASRLARR